MSVRRGTIVVLAAFALMIGAVLLSASVIRTCVAWMTVVSDGVGHLFSASLPVFEILAILSDIGTPFRGNLSEIKGKDELEAHLQPNHW